MDGSYIQFEGANNHLTSLSSEHSGLYLNGSFDEKVALVVDGDIRAGWSLQTFALDSVTCQKIIGGEVRVLNTNNLSCTRIEARDMTSVFMGSNISVSGPVIFRSQYKSNWLRIDSTHLNICAVGEIPLQTDAELHIDQNSQGHRPRPPHCRGRHSHPRRSRRRRRLPL